HASGGSVDLACRELGLAYRVEEEPAPLFPLLFGRLYHNVAEGRRRAPRISRLDVKRIVRNARSIEQRWRSEVGPETEARLVVPAAADFNGLETDALIRTIAEIAERFVTETHVEAEIVNIAVDIVVGEARAKLVKAGEDPAQWLVPEVPSLFERALRTAASARQTSEAFRYAHGTVGHRAALDYELAAPRYAEDQRGLSRLVDSYRALGERGGDAGPDAAGLPKRLARLVDAARRLQVLKEDAKHVALIELAMLRRALLALDRRLGLDGRIFLLSLQEIAGLDAAGIARTSAITHAREAEARLVDNAAALPSTLTLEAIETSSWPKSPDVTTGDKRALKGVRVAGTTAVSGRAFIASMEQAEAGAPLDSFASGDILVAPFVHPAWLGEVLRSGGVVTASGGWLSHMAIVARERGIAMLTGVDGWASIQSGTEITLAIDGRIEIHTPIQPGMEANDASGDVLEPAAWEPRYLLQQQG
ncbi:MAG: hypothetical protein JSS20_17750, partial [Proteobacteria bacterium]|nr:hypothetical protein [Pseudomonadota bacterium]